MMTPILDSDNKKYPLDEELMGSLLVKGMYIVTIRLSRSSPIQTDMAHTSIRLSTEIVFLE